MTKRSLKETTVALLLILLCIGLVAWVSRPMVYLWLAEQATVKLAANDWTGAERRLKAGAYLGDVSAMAQLGALNIAGNGRVPNRDAAEYWFLKCANAGNPACEEMLGLLYYAGYGKAPDIGSARFWLEKAAASGRPDAKKFLLMIEQGRRYPLI